MAVSCSLKNLFGQPWPWLCYKIWSFKNEFKEQAVSHIESCEAAVFLLSALLLGRAVSVTQPRLGLAGPRTGLPARIPTLLTLVKSLQ